MGYLVSQGHKFFICYKILATKWKPLFFWNKRIQLEFLSYNTEKNNNLLIIKKFLIICFEKLCYFLI